MEAIDETKLKIEFEGNSDIQAEFGGDVKAYIAFKLAESEGRIGGRLGGLKSSVHANPTEIGPGPGDEESWKQEFSASADLQREYGNDVTSYLAFKKAEAAGRAKLCSGHGIVAFSSAPAPETEEEIPGKGLPISEPVREAFAEAANRAKEKVRSDEKRQYAAGVPCTP